MRKLTLLGVACSLSSALSYADTQVKDETNAIEKISVVGAATNFSITAEEIEQFQANDLADIFRESPSISVGGSVGVAQKIFVRGLEDAYLNVTVDGAQQTSTLFHHIGRVTLDPDLLKQIDVQAGAGEATSGPGAIGGSIRFKTKNAQDLLQGDESFGGSVKANYFSNDGTRYSGSLYGKLSDSWGVLGYYSTIDRDNMEDGNGDEIYGTAADQDLMFVKVSGDIADNQFLSLSYEKRDEEGEFSARPNWVVLEGAALYPSVADRETIVGNYLLDHSDMVYLEATAYQTSSSFRGGRFDWLAEIDSTGFDIRNTSVTPNHSFTYGIDYRSDKAQSGPAAGSVENEEEGSALGIYAQAHSNLSPELLLSYGVRFDDYDFQQRILLEEYYGTPVTDSPAALSDSEFSFNLGLSYELTDHWSLALGYAEAARGKEIGDGFTLDEYLYDGEDIPVVADDVVPETVENLEASIEYKHTNLNARFSLYQSTIYDVLFSGYEGNSVYNNIGDLESTGIEFDLAYTWENVDLFFGFSSADTELAPREGIYNVDYPSIDINGYEFVGLGNSRGNTWILGLDYEVNDNASVGINITKVDEINIDTMHQAVDLGWTDALYRLNKPSYTTVDIYGEWNITESFAVNLAVTNLFDKLYLDHSSVGDYSEVFASVIGPYEAGRDIRLSVSYEF
ncbi:TonB-dependent receptor [Paraglaciecola sp. 2405UD69-4]|uniref:TonB-dependent receptor n=1 Tax=Paraglaciecola sp. 2405UD69-4 TaxID=3391836 RepID=UPI0039C9996F